MPGERHCTLSALAWSCFLSSKIVVADSISSRGTYATCSERETVVANPSVIPDFIILRA